MFPFIQKKCVSSTYCVPREKKKAIMVSALIKYLREMIVNKSAHKIIRIPLKAKFH